MVSVLHLQTKHFCFAATARFSLAWAGMPWHLLQRLCQRTRCRFGPRCRSHCPPWLACCAVAAGLPLRAVRTQTPTPYGWDRDRDGAFNAASPLRAWKAEANSLRKRQGSLSKVQHP